MSSDSKKFFFDQHNFDDGAIDTTAKYQDDLPPPPPLFTEDELEAVKKQAFNEGKAQGLKDSEASQQAALLKNLEAVQRFAGQLMQAEDSRRAQYENEVVLLCDALFTALFPLYYEAQGQEELRQILQQTLDQQKPDQALELAVSTADFDIISDFVHGHPLHESIKIITRDQFHSGQVELNWAYGGTIVNIPHTTQEIRAILQQTLEEKGLKRHDVEELSGTEPALESVKDENASIEDQKTEPLTEDLAPSEIPSDEVQAPPEKDNDEQ